MDRLICLGSGAVKIGKDGHEILVLRNPRKKRPFLTPKNQIRKRALKGLQRVLKTVHGARRTKLSKWARKMTEFRKKNPYLTFSISRGHTYIHIYLYTHFFSNSIYIHTPCIYIHTPKIFRACGGLR